LKSEAYISNDKALAEINATLTHPTNGKGKIGIYLPTGAGDIMSAMSVLKYKDDYADIFIGVSSGVSVATSAWGLKPTPKIQYCNSFQCSTSAMANRVFELIKPSKEHNKITNNNEKSSILKNIFAERLTKLLNTIGK